eukprot:196008_1
MADSIIVLCRFRPQNSREKAANAYIVVQVSDCHTLCVVTHPDKSKQPKPLSFNFDCVFDWTSTQTEVYEHAASHLVEQVFDGFNATIFAYGQTGAGKTYSMEGKLGSPHRGIVPRTVENIFENIADSDEDMEYLLQVSYVEIYLEALRDLLKPGNASMKIRDSKTGVFIENVTEMYVRDAQEVMDLMTMGSRARTTGATAMNAASPRSHGVFMLKLSQTNTKSGTKKVSKLMMIDLAGSEKVSKTGATGMLLKEAQKINQSLSALGNVMGQLSAGKGHVSYRDSVLTRLLSDSLGGNCKTTLLIAVSPSSFNADETITTARFGVRAKKIKNKAKINAEKTVAEYKKEVTVLLDRILKLQALVSALQADLAGGDTSKSDALIAMVDMQYLMDDGKGKKKKKAKKKKGFFRPGFEPQPKQTKKKANGSTDLAEAEDRAEKAEQHIQYLEAELIKAQAAAATNSGLADVEPAPSPRKRVSILPAPHRPRASLLPTHAIAVPLTIAEEDGKTQPHDAPSFSNEFSSNSFVTVHGGIESEEHVIVTQVQMQMPSHLADLDPAMLEQARRGLQQENYDLRKQMEQLVHELDQMKIRIQKKTESIKLEKNKTEDAEMECDRLLLQQQVLEERIESFEQDRKRERKQIQSFRNENQLYKLEVTELKTKLAAKQKEMQAQIMKISRREAKRADDFMQQAIQQFKRLQNKQREQQAIASPSATASAATGSIYNRMNVEQQQNELSRQRIIMDQQMQTLKRATFEQLERIQLEQMRVKSALQTKIEECVALNIQLSDKNDEITKLVQKIRQKDANLHR